MSFFEEMIKKEREEVKKIAKEAIVDIQKSADGQIDLINAIEQLTKDIPEEEIEKYAPDSAIEDGEEVIAQVTDPWARRTYSAYKKFVVESKKSMQKFEASYADQNYDMEEIRQKISIIKSQLNLWQDLVWKILENELTLPEDNPAIRANWQLVKLPKNDYYDSLKKLKILFHELFEIE